MHRKEHLCVCTKASFDIFYFTHIAPNMKQVVCIISAATLFPAVLNMPTGKESKKQKQAGKECDVNLLTYQGTDSSTSFILPYRTNFSPGSVAIKVFKLNVQFCICALNGPVPCGRAKIALSTGLSSGCGNSDSLGRTSNVTTYIKGDFSPFPPEVATYAITAPNSGKITESTSTQLDIYYIENQIQHYGARINKSAKKLQHATLPRHVKSWKHKGQYAAVKWINLPVSSCS
eukprot:284815761_5